MQSVEYVEDQMENIAAGVDLLVRENAHELHVAKLRRRFNDGRYGEGSRSGCYGSMPLHMCGHCGGAKHGRGERVCCHC